MPRCCGKGCAEGWLQSSGQELLLGAGAGVLMMHKVLPCRLGLSLMFFPLNGLKN